VDGLMMDYPLTIAFILRRAETLFGHKAIITRRPDKTLHRYTYADFVPRAKKLAVALRQLGLRRGDRVATLCWNQYEHLEAYFGVPLAGNVLPVVPMFHVNAWGLPFTCTMVGATQIHPGPHLDAESLCDLFVGEHVTYTAGVPTIWLGLLRRLDERPKEYDLSRLRLLVVGGSAAPKSMIRGFDERHGLRVRHAWGVTETTPLGVASSLMSDLEQADAETRFAYRAKQGYPVPLVEIR